MKILPHGLPSKYCNSCKYSNEGTTQVVGKSIYGFCILTGTLIEAIIIEETWDRLYPIPGDCELSDKS